MYDYDLVVIGSGPAGEKGAVQAAYFGKRVAVIEKSPALGGACVNTGTLPSKTLRETALFLSGYRQREMYGLSCGIDGAPSVPELMCRQAPVTGHEGQRIAANLARHKVDLLEGAASFLDDHTLEIAMAEGAPRRISTDVTLIATGSTPHRPAFVPFEDPEVDDSDSILRLDRIPRAMIVLGGGVIGCEYASIFAALGTRCVIIEGRDQILGFLDGEVNQLLTEELRGLGCEILFKREVVEVGRSGGKLHCRLSDGSDLECERLLFAGGRAGNTRTLGLQRVNAVADARGLLKIDEHFRVAGVASGRVYAAGDVIGFPALASVAMEQGRVAVCHAFGFEYKQKVASQFPYGLYTIPEVSMIGETEESAKKKGLDFEVGRARYADNARGQIVGDVSGLTKLIFDAKDKKLLGVHIIGERATELIHIGAAVMHFGGRIDDFIEQVFNFPTLGEMYKYAAYDGLGRLHARNKVIAQ
ncbi:MAG: Soluble pyridine nucleotide transhydrogenase [Myxococcales bacterium]|nr:Soluble pyridine nucleotide transhydrogenase [Myxococcales bacterium]